MKKISWLIVCNLFMLCFALSCSQSGNHSNYKVSESERYYTIKAKYDESQSGKVDRFMTNYFEKDNNISFINTVIDADMKLDDGTKFYIKKQPGYIFIKFNKEENQPAAFRQIKLLGQRLKFVITNQ